MDTTPAETYLAEAQDLLLQIEATALELSDGAGDADAINRLFRAFHTIKGSGAMFGFTAVAEFTHHVETTLDLVRSGTLPMTAPLITLVLASKDHITALLGDTADPKVGEEIIQQLESISGAPKVQTASPTPTQANTSDHSDNKFCVDFRPNPGIASSGLDPMSLLGELRLLGECKVTLLTDRLPGLDSFNPEMCYLGWKVELTTAADENAIRDVFMFAEDGAELRIERLRKESATRGTPSLFQSSQKAAGEEKHKGTGPTSVVKVAASRLDRLVSLVGELVMNQSRLNRAAAGIQDSDISAPVEAFERLIAELRDSVLGIRMTPIGTTFGRFRRLVHDLSRDLNKEVELITRGEETELDKTVLDQLADPLVHLIRNSLDHGIEPADTRRAAGKTPRGTIRLTASQQGSEIIVEIADDGRGLSAQAIRKKAIERGLIQSTTELPEAELYNLIFMPGFSTAEQVTSVSGRGVGMDVVRRQVETLRGTVRLSSTPGQGTTVTLALPVTLAIIDGLLVQVGNDPFILPMAAVLENVELPHTARSGRRDVVAVRGDLVPFIRLREVFDVAGEVPEFEKIVVVSHGGQRVGIVVDRVLGNHQTVIQSLNRFCRGIEVISGTTIMGDGRVALILDIAGVLRTEAAKAA